MEWEKIIEKSKTIQSFKLSIIIENCKNYGVTLEETQEKIKNYICYVEKERGAMPPELRELDPIITNYLAQEENTEFRNEISTIADNAGGRKFLSEKILKPLEIERLYLLMDNIVKKKLFML